MSARTLDCSDIDNFLGKAMQPARMVEALHNNDFRRWVQGMHYPNRLHYDAEYAAESRFGQLIAPQSFPIVCDDGHGSSPACVGRIANSHLLFGGDEWWFYGPHIIAGDRITNKRVPLDYVVKETKFAGPTCFQRGDNFYYNQKGELIAKQRQTTIRYSVEYAQEMNSLTAAEEPEWTDEQIALLEARKLEWIQMMHDLGHGKRYWDDVSVADKLPTRVFGPHSISSLATEWRAYLFTIWGSTHRRTDLDLEALGFTKDMAGHENDPVMERINPELTDGAYYGPSRGHQFVRWARRIGMPRPYGYGASMVSWVTDYLAGWAGEWGKVIHQNTHLRGPAYAGDITIMTGAITDKRVDEDGRPIVQIEGKMTNQEGTILGTSKGEIELIRRG
jgi:hypothetical protein